MRKAAWALWGELARGVRLAAVTGTNGKTTVSSLLRLMLASGGSAGLVSTFGIDLGAGVGPTGFTTPETAELLGAVAEARLAGMRWCVLEVSSHALALGRVDGFAFDVAVFTNLSRDHLDFHGDMEAYLDAKAILFDRLEDKAVAVLNRADPASGELARRTRARVVFTGCTEDCDVRVETLAPAGNVRLSVAGETIQFGWRLRGTHNCLNLASAAGAAHAAGVALDDIARTAESFRGIRGRLEPVEAGQDFAVLVDYAHTPDALDAVLRSLRPETKGRLICVFGCGGDRDRSKRAPMGAIVSELADTAIVTSDNPRSEDPARIIEEILAGIADRSRLSVEPDRAKAIAVAIESAGKGDVVVIAGKGHETEQIVGAERRPFDDRAVALAALGARS